MGEYHRITRECTLDSMRPELAAAIRNHIEKYGLEGVETSVLMCCETVSTKQKKSLFSRKTEVVLLGAFLTSKWLIWAVGKENEVPGVLSTRLDDIRVEDYEDTQMYKMIQDTGVNVLGLRVEEGSAGSAFIGLGPEPASQKFREMLKEAIKKV